MDADCAEVVRREVALLTPAVRADLPAVLALLHPDFVEFGASGRVWDLGSVAATLAPDPDPPEARDLCPVRLAADVVLLTYRSVRAVRVSLRSSVWVRDTERGWLLRFHQGTVTGPWAR